MAQVDARQRAPRLERSRRDRWIAGVAGGIGHHLGVQPSIVRIAFVVSSFAAGFGLVVYVLTWLLAPLETLADGVEPPPRRIRLPTPGSSRRHRPRHRRDPRVALVCRPLVPRQSRLAGGARRHRLRGPVGARRWRKGPLEPRDPGDTVVRHAVRDRSGADPGGNGGLPGRPDVDRGSGQRAAGDDRGARRRRAARRPVDLGHGPPARRRAQQPRPVRGARRDGRAPPRLGSPDAGAHPARQGAARDGEPRPHPGAGAASLALRARARAGRGAAARRDRLDGRADRATAPGERGGGRRRRRGDGRAPPRPRQRVRRGRRQRGGPLRDDRDQRLRRGRGGRDHAPSSATRAPASTPTPCPPTGAASRTRSSVAWSATAGARRSISRPGAGTEVVLKLPRREP